MCEEGILYIPYMRISVHVTARSKRNEVIKIDDTSFRVRVTAPPVEGKANDMVVELLAEYFRKPKRSISIRKGDSSREKIIEIL